MPLEKSEAVVLKMFNWSESSRTVHFFTRSHGRLPLMDRGGRRLQSKRGRLQLFARLDLTFYSSKKESTGTISDVEVLETFSLEGEGGLGRLAFASAGCELLYLLLPEGESQEALFTYFLSYLRQISSVDRKSLPAVFLAFFMRLMSQLGYRPSVAFCAGCGKSAEEIANGRGRMNFSPERGGLVCGTCQKPGEQYIPISAEGARLLSALQRASLSEAATLPISYAEATLLIEVLTKFLRYHAETVSDLKSLSFLEKLRKTQLNEL